MGWTLLGRGPYRPPAWSRRVLLRLTSGPLDALGPSLPPPGPSRQEWGTAEPGVSWGPGYYLPSKSVFSKCFNN